MYNAHRGMQAPAPQPGSRLAELLDQVRAEFEAAAGRSSEHEHQRESSPFPIAPHEKKAWSITATCI